MHPLSIHATHIYKMYRITGILLDSIGTILIAYMTLQVHHRVKEEHKIDQKVFVTMKREQFLGILGILLVAIGTILEVISD